MKCGPDGCPIVAFSDLTPAEQRVQRQRLAKKMEGQGFTEQQIAKHFGVSQATISGDLSNLSTTDKLKPTKTESNPKGAGRPKGSKPKRKYQDVEPIVATLVLDEGQTHAQARAATGVSDTVVRHAVAREEGRREAEPTITPEMLSLTAQQKLDLAVKQHKQKLAAGFQAEVQRRVMQLYSEVWLPEHSKLIADAKKIMDRRVGIMTKATFDSIRRALHPDSRQSISDKKLSEAFDTFMGLEKMLLDEKDSPTNVPPLPDNLAAWDRMRYKAKAMKRANVMQRR